MRVMGDRLVTVGDGFRTRTPASDAGVTDVMDVTGSDRKPRLKVLDPPNTGPSIETILEMLVDRVGHQIGQATVRYLEQREGPLRGASGLPALLTAKEVAERLRLPESRIYEMVRRGLIPHLRIGRNVRFEERALEVWLRGCATRV